MKHLDLTAGEYLFKQNDRSDCAFLVVSGQVDILMEKEGQTGLVATLGEGQIIGEMGLIDESPRSATARAKVDSVLEVVDQDAFIQKLTQDPQSCMKYLHVLFERLRRSNARMTINKPPACAVPEGEQFHVILKPISDAAKDVIPDDAVMITNFPYFIGRESAHSFQTNDLQIKDKKPFQVSRNHLSIERDADHIVVRDRGSFNGTRVNEQKIGRHAASDGMVLTPGINTITVGGHQSPYQFHAELKFTKIQKS